jgi:hypothetical protein
MKNRAKCRKCESVIESFYADDYVSCKCNAIYVDGGTAMRCGAYNWDDFLRVDDAGNVIIPKIQSDIPRKENNKPNEIVKSKRQQQLEVINDMITRFESLPQHIMSQPIDHYDFVSLLLFIKSVLDDS